jgi:TRAP-type C4-dicarboxylate transport system permease small subunit
MNRNSINKILEAVLVFLMGIMTLDVLWGVFTRYALGAQSSWTEELARYLLIWIGILGAAYASGKNMHLAIDILPGKLSGNLKLKLKYLISSIIILFVFAIMIIGGLRLVYISFILGQTSAALKLPLYLVYVIVPVSGVLVIYFRSFDFKNSVRPNN